MSHKIILSIKEKDISLMIQGEEGVVAQADWTDNNDLLEEFFPRHRTLLESKSLSQRDIAEYALETDVPNGFTTVRIAQTLIATLNFALEE